MEDGTRRRERRFPERPAEVRSSTNVDVRYGDGSRFSVTIVARNVDGTGVRLVEVTDLEVPVFRAPVMPISGVDLRKRVPAGPDVVQAGGVTELRVYRVDGWPVQPVTDGMVAIIRREGQPDQAVVRSREVHHGDGRRSITVASSLDGEASSKATALRRIAADRDFPTDWATVTIVVEGADRQFDLAMAGRTWVAVGDMEDVAERDSPRWVSPGRTQRRGTSGGVGAGEPLSRSADDGLVRRMPVTPLARDRTADIDGLVGVHPRSGTGARSGERSGDRRSSARGGHVSSVGID